ncbi:hypothetical protein [Vibrio alginolyticus]|uniref:hypothetical protein n=1 Tax=Vibrio alginolyticus TaxID=663 RepID=UPI00211A1905|nr:hypothetical protein [Vibrio alginolyticus]MCQ9087367.1 hypothetical protein [Vibrio alginolyticus]
MTDDELKEIFASAPVAKDTFEVIAIAAPWFSQTYYLQNAFTEAVYVPLEDDTEVLAKYAPMSIGQANNNSDMTYTREITIEQVNDVIAGEISKRDPLLRQKVSIESRGYVMYRDGSISSLKTPVVKTSVTSTVRDSVGTTITTSAKPVNRTTTGIVATVSRVPMLAGFL